MAESFALKLQTLPFVGDRILVIGQIAGLSNTTGEFTAADVDRLFDAFRVPRPSKTSTILGQLSGKGVVVRVGSNWALTPVGEERVREVIGGISTETARGALTRAPGAELGHAQQVVLPPALAPARWSRGISQLLKVSPFDSNVFCMTRFPDPEARQDPLAETISTARAVLRQHGLALYLASDAIVDDDLLANIAAYMWACKYGIAIFEDRVGKRLNYNLVTEVGAMLMAGRRCVLLKDKTAPDMPTDLIGQIYRRVDLDDQSTVASALHSWVADDLGLGKCASCREKTTKGG